MSAPAKAPQANGGQAYDLAPGERLVRTDHPHPIIFAPSLLLLLIFLFTAAASGATVVYLLAALTIVNLAWQAWCRQRSRFVLTSERFILIVHQRLRQQVHREYPWSCLFQVLSQRGLFGRFLGYGTLALRFDRAQPPIGVAYIPQVSDYEHYMRGQVREYAKRRIATLRENLSEVGSMLEIDAREFEKLL